MTSKTNKGIELHVEAKLIYESANTSIQIFQKASSSAFAVVCKISVHCVDSTLVSSYRETEHLHSA